MIFFLVVSYFAWEDKKFSATSDRSMQSLSLPQETMVGEENTELSLQLQLQCGEETVPFINPFTRRGSRFSCSTLCETATTAYHNGNKPLSGYMLFYFDSCLNILNLSKIFWAEMVLLFNSYRPGYG